MYIASGIFFFVRIGALLGLLVAAARWSLAPRGGDGSLTSVVALVAAAWVAKGLQEECLRAAVAGDRTRK